MNAEPLAQVAADLPSVRRTKTMELTPVGADSYRLISRLTDISCHTDLGSRPDDGVIHDFVIEAELAGPELVIATLNVRAETHPYAQCPAILPKCQALIGQSLSSGWRRLVLDTLGRTAGCTHVTTLLIGLAEAQTMAYFLQMNTAEAYTRETRADGRWTAVGLDLAPSIVGACHVLEAKGQVVETARNVLDRCAVSERNAAEADSHPH
jgi:hypothetical protein